MISILVTSRAENIRHLYLTLNSLSKVIGVEDSRIGVFINGKLSNEVELSNSCKDLYIVEHQQQVGEFLNWIEGLEWSLQSNEADIVVDLREGYLLRPDTLEYITKVVQFEFFRRHLFFSLSGLEFNILNHFRPHGNFIVRDRLKYMYEHASPLKNTCRSVTEFCDLFLQAQQGTTLLPDKHYTACLYPGHRGIRASDLTHELEEYLFTGELSNLHERAISVFDMGKYSEIVWPKDFVYEY